MRFCLLNSVNDTTRPRLALLIFVAALVGLSLATPALAQFNKKGKKAPAAAADAAAEGIATVIKFLLRADGCVARWPSCAGSSAGNKGLPYA